MKFAFQKIRLEADSFISLVSTWAEMQLVVTPDAAILSGYGFAADIAEAFTTLVLDWEASIFLPKETLALGTGTYDLITIEDRLYACREQEKFLLTNAACMVEVVAVEE